MSDVTEIADAEDRRVRIIRKLLAEAARIHAEMVVLHPEDAKTYDERLKTYKETISD